MRQDGSKNEIDEGYKYDGYPGYSNNSNYYVPCDNFGSNLLPIDWEKHTLVDFRRNFYVEHPMTASRSSEEINDLMCEHEISVSGIDIKPICSFEEANFPDYILQEIKSSHFNVPYPIQMFGWPVALSGKDMVGLARTGSGKTLAYLLPGILHIHAQVPLQSNDGPIVLILSPTRELALQIQKESIKFSKASNIRSVCIYGGVARMHQMNELKKGTEIVIATPGRLLDFLDMGITNLKRVSYLVLDEADRMLDMGFEPQMRKIVSQVRPDRQVLMWSATWPREIQNLAHDFCSKNPAKVTIGSKDLQANPNIYQIVVVCTPQERDAQLVEFLNTHYQLNNKILIFCETKKGCDQLMMKLRSLSISSLAIHGDKEQKERDRILYDFKSNKCKVLIATDVASRGLDIKNIQHVINYDCPKTIEDYIHRIGRTGRAGNKGTAITYFVCDINNPSTDKSRMARDIARIMRDVDQAPSDDLIRIGGPVPKQEALRQWGGKGLNALQKKHNNQSYYLKNNFISQNNHQRPPANTAHYSHNNTYHANHYGHPTNVNAKHNNTAANTPIAHNISSNNNNNTNGQPSYYPSVYQSNNGSVYSSPHYPIHSPNGNALTHTVTNSTTNTSSNITYNHHHSALNNKGPTYNQNHNKPNHIYASQPQSTQQASQQSQQQQSQLIGANHVNGSTPNAPQFYAPSYSHFSMHNTYPNHHMQQGNGNTPNYYQMNNSHHGNINNIQGSYNQPHNQHQHNYRNRYHNNYDINNQYGKPLFSPIPPPPNHSHNDQSLHSNNNITAHATSHITHPNSLSSNLHQTNAHQGAHAHQLPNAGTPQQGSTHHNNTQMQSTVHPSINTHQQNSVAPTPSTTTPTTVNTNAGSGVQSNGHMSPHLSHHNQHNHHHSQNKSANGNYRHHSSNNNPSKITNKPAVKNIHPENIQKVEEKN